MSAFTKKPQDIANKLQDVLNNSYLDVQGLTPGNITETQIARLLTKVAVGSVTVFWSIIELKNIVKFRKSLRG